MRKYLTLPISLVITLLQTACTNQKNQSQTTVSQNVQKTKTKNLIIYYDAKQGKDVLLKKAASFGAEIFYDYKNINAIAVKIPNEKTVEDAEKYFGSIPGVLSVTQDKAVSLY